MSAHNTLSGYGLLITILVMLPISASFSQQEDAVAAGDQIDSSNTTIAQPDSDVDDQEATATQEAAETRELGAEENPGIASRAARAAAREETEEQTQEQEEIIESAEEAQEMLESETRELNAEENPEVARRASRAAAREETQEQEEAIESAEEAQETLEAETRELGAEENPGIARRAARAAEREESQEQEQEEAIESAEEAQETLEEAIERELAVEKDPSLQDQAEREAAREAVTSSSSVEHDTGINFYGSLRVRSRGGDGDTEFEDASSRVGTDIELQFKQGAYVFARYEAGFNVLAVGGPGDSSDGSKSSERLSDTVFTRLAYVGIDTRSIAATMGKSWSTYYSVTSFTDRFTGTGASASGTFNAQTAGGATGTGRADGVLQSYLTVDFLPEKWFKPFDLNFQVQHGNTIPFSDGIDYGTAFGFSAILTTLKNYTFGLAYNQADTHLELNPALRQIGISGKAKAAVIGTRAFGDKWYAGFLVSRLNSHETTDTGIYFDGWGSEFYGQYQLLDRLWLTGGYNILKPDSDQTQAEEYYLKYAVIGLRYTFDDFKRMLYANIRNENTTLADGSTRSNVYTVGIKWDLSNRGWSMNSTADAPPPTVLE